jgi:2,4-didehydro-3-deoxy-L-rhamnonate hydrolase
VKLIAYSQDGTATIGVVGADGIVGLGTVDEFYRDVSSGLRRAAAAEQEVGIDPSGLTLLPPVPATSRVLCVGLNYRAHAAEASRELPSAPNIFGRWPSTLVGADAPVPVPVGETHFDYEGELAAVVGGYLRAATQDEAQAAVLGYTCFNDLSARDFQGRTSQWSLGKNADRSGPIGPWIVTADEITDPYELRLSTRVNGETLQEVKTGDMIFPVAEILAYASQCMTLRPGDVLATGTPEGVGYLRNPPITLTGGDVVEVDIEQIGVLRTPIVAPTADLL